MSPLPRAHGGKRRPVSVAQKKTWGLRGPEARAGLGFARDSAGRLLFGDWANFGDPSLCSPLGAEK